MTTRERLAKEVDRAILECEGETIVPAITALILRERQKVWREAAALLTVLATQGHFTHEIANQFKARAEQGGGVMKIVINTCYGGFSISLEAARYMANKGHAAAKAEVEDWERDQAAVDHFLKTGKWTCPKDKVKWLAIAAQYGGKVTFHGYGYHGEHHGYERNDPLLIEAVETLKKKADGEHAGLSVVEIPDGVAWEIDEYDGVETIHEKHRSWS